MFRINLIFKIIFLINYIVFPLCEGFAYNLPHERFFTPGEKCLRVCSENEIPKMCHFNWVFENYNAMAASCGKCLNGEIEDCYKKFCVTGDGIERGVMSINRQIPGPAIHVCKNDIVIIDVMNTMSGSAAAMHWHGVFQEETPFMDGVPFITQCPINFGNKFRYAFKANQAGTQFYHSHAGHHKSNGLYGPLIIHDFIKNDPNNIFYDYDLTNHVIVLSDWMHNLAEMVVPGLETATAIRADNILINGHGKFKNSKLPLAVFSVKRGKRYRFRLINSASHTCQYQIQIEDHPIKVISTDSFSVKPVEVDVLVSSSGERFDFILNANMESRDYLMEFKGVEFCNTQNLTQYAILHYTDDEVNNTQFDKYTKEMELNLPKLIQSSSLNKENRPRKSLNNPSAARNANPNTFVNIANINAYTPQPISKVDYQFVQTFQNHIVDFDQTLNHSYINIGNNVSVSGAMNYISFKFPSFPLLTQPYDIDSDTFCTEKELRECTSKSLCYCTQRLAVPLNAVVEMIIIDSTPANIVNPMNHPFHLHGHAFSVLAQGVLPRNCFSNLKECVKNLRRPTSMNQYFPIKDTITVPNNGYVIIRFKADNPGFWIVHCHFEWHLGAGMGLVYQVGETHEMVQAPENFPKCNNFNIRLTDTE